MLQLFSDTHQDYVARNSALVDRELSQDERVFFVRLLGRQSHPGFPALIVGYLEAQDERVRAVAAATVSKLDQALFLDQLKQRARAESSVAVLQELAMSLNLTAYPATQEVLQHMVDRHIGEVDRAILTLWSTSKLPNNKELIAGMADSADPETGAMAKHLLVMLDKKDHLSLTPTLAAQESAPLEVEPRLQEALTIAIRSDDLAAIETLLAEGAQLNAADARGHVPFAAALYAQVSTLKFCIEKGADLGKGTGDNALMALARSAYKDERENINLLIDAGIDPNETNDSGETALFFACLANRTEVARVLIERGADPNHRDNLGRRALDIARLMENSHLVQLLEPLSSP